MAAVAPRDSVILLAALHGACVPVAYFVQQVLGGRASAAQGVAVWLLVCSAQAYGSWYRAGASSGALLLGAQAKLVVSAAFVHACAAAPVGGGGDYAGDWVLLGAFAVPELLFGIYFAARACWAPRGTEPAGGHGSPKVSPGRSAARKGSARRLSGRRRLGGKTGRKGKVQHVNVQGAIEQLAALDSAVAAARQVKRAQLKCRLTYFPKQEPRQ